MFAFKFQGYKNKLYAGKIPSCVSQLGVRLHAVLVSSESDSMLCYCSQLGVRLHAVLVSLESDSMLC